MTEKKPWDYNVLAGAATVHGESFLLLRRSRRESFLPDVWGIPAGQVRHREDPRTACARELLEETGLHGEVIDLVGYSTFESERDGIELSNVQLNFLVRVHDSEVILNQRSHSEAQWISVDDAANDKLDAFTKEILESVQVHYKESAGSRLARS
jgi:8-oxo-dGTP diphosphatase